jgi:hypothetical protein
MKSDKNVWNDSEYVRVADFVYTIMDPDYHDRLHYENNYLRLDYD